MQKIKYNNQEFLAKSIASNNYNGVTTLEITFADDVTFAEVQSFYDTNKSLDSLRRMEIYDEMIEYLSSNDEDAEPAASLSYNLQGVHIGYTKPIDISYFGGVIKVKVEKELSVESNVAELRNEVDILTIKQLESEGIL